ncbi:MAG: hypothetical protein ACR2QR_10885 [Woeseiaceae bacterium]
MRHALAILLLVLSTAGAAQNVVPVYEEPFHRLVADNSAFKILDILIPPGGTTLYHRHAEPTFYVTLNRTAVRAQMLGREWSAPSVPTAKPGSVSHDDESRERPFEHRVNNVSDEGFRLMLITNDRREPYAPDLDVIGSMPGKPGIDSNYFSQSRIDLAPGEQLDWDGVKHQVIFVLVTDSHVVIRDKTVRSSAWGMHDPGDFEYIDGDNGYLFENRSEQDATIIAVAIR